jgi:hypothetical protein
MKLRGGNMRMQKYKELKRLLLKIMTRDEVDDFMELHDIDDNNINDALVAVRYYHGI